MHIDLSGKTALVSGSSAGIGYAIARGLAQAGATVILNGRDPGPVETALAALQAEAPHASLRAAAGDLSTGEGAEAVQAAAPDVDILVNNAGIYGPGPFFDTDDAEWERYFQTNVMSAVRLSRAYLPGMLERDWGRVVFIASESALNIPPDMIHYGMSKTALMAIARGLAKVASGTGVTVNSVLPGPTLSDGFKAMFEEQARAEGRSIEEVGRDFVRAQRPSSILGRPTTPEEVASLVVYACSPQASATTGAALRADGGVVDTL